MVMNWIGCFPIGDWHILHKYQKVLMKAYFEASLKFLAMCSGHSAEIIKSISGATNFN